MERIRRHSGRYLVLALIFANAYIYYAVYADGPQELTVAFLDVGQGDAVYIESPSKIQVLVDGGPANGAVLSALGAVMPLYDRTIDMLIVTNPDEDHFGGFLAVLERYSIESVMEPGTMGKSKLYLEFEKAVDREAAARVFARRGQMVDLGGGAYLNILFPDRAVTQEKTNDGSIVMQLIYGDTEIMFTGDTTKRMERYLVALDGKKLQSDVLKVAHHGSRTSTSESFVAAVAPTYAVISDGKENRYGHPHQETLDTFEGAGVTVFRTDESGTIIMHSNGVLIGP